MSTLAHDATAPTDRPAQRPLNEITLDLGYVILDIEQAENIAAVTVLDAKVRALHREIERISRRMAQESGPRLVKPKKHAKTPRCNEHNHKAARCRLEKGHEPPCDFKTRWERPIEVAKLDGKELK